MLSPQIWQGARGDTGQKIFLDIILNKLYNNQIVLLSEVEMLNFEDVVESEAVLKAIENAGLTEAQREALLLFWQDVPVNKIAEELGITRASVHGRLVLALNKLKRMAGEILVSGENTAVTQVKRKAEARTLDEIGEEERTTVCQRVASGQKLSLVARLHKTTVPVVRKVLWEGGECYGTPYLHSDAETRLSKIEVWEICEFFNRFTHTCPSMLAKVFDCPEEVVRLVLQKHELNPDRVPTNLPEENY
jgi:predicted DNA-binding protein YlxM (UPF0122 family)